MDSKEEEPVLISDDSNYLAIKNGYTSRKSLLSEGETLIITGSSIDRMPGGWIYSKYSRGHIVGLRILNILGFLLELGGFLAGEYLTDFGTRYSSSNESPFTIDPYFESSIWVFILFLSLFLLPVLFKKSTNSIAFLTEKVKFYHFPVCMFLGLYLFSRRLYDNTISFIFNDIFLFLIAILLFYIYSKIKYEEDGRYRVSWIEYIGIHLQFSVLVALVLVEMFRCVLITAIKIQKVHSRELFGWDFNNWTVLIMSIVFVLGVIVLTMYKDIYFAAVLGYNFFGVYVIQYKSDCLSTNCSSSVKEAALILGIMTFGFIILTIGFYPRLICYNLRSRV